MGGVEYQVTKVDPTDPHTKGAVYQVHKVSEEIAATLGGKVYRARIINDPTAPTVAGKVYQIVLIGDPSDPAVKGKVYNAILTGGSEAVVVGPAVSPLSLPDAIADSLTYVKAFGGTEQRNIPQPYTQVNYVTNTAQTAVDTGIMIDFAKNYEFEVECRAVSGSWYILQSRASSSGNVTGISGATSGSTITLIVGNVTVCTSAITRTVGNKLYVKATLNAGVATLYVKDETANTEDTQTGSYGTTQPNPTAAVYLLGNAGGQYVDVNSDIYMARIKENDTVVMDYVPARQVATAGFYDKASGTFKTALTPANLSADGNTVPTPDTPMDIVSNNGVLKYGRIGKNLVNPDAVTLNSYINTSGAIVSDNGYVISDYIPVQGGQKITMSTTHTSGYPFGGVACKAFYDSDKNYISNSATPNSGINATNPATLVVPAGAAYFRTSIGSSAALYVQVEYGDTATTFEPYKAGIYADGTVETINVHGKNLLNPASGDSYSATIYRWYYTDGFTLKANQPYTISCDDTVVVYFMKKSDDSILVYGLNNVTYTPTEDIVVYFRIYKSGGLPETFNAQLELGSTATDYAPYYDGGTATAEMLLKVGDYQDVQSIIDGAVTRNVGIKIFNGTETGDNGWFISTTIIYSNFPRQVGAVYNTNAVICSHSPNTKIDGSGSWISGFSITKFPTVADLNTFCAEQYAAGTPVMVIYPLATPTTESVAGQTLQVTDGDNVLEITQASLNNLELEAEYEKEAD